MGQIKQGILGGFRGKVGTVVGCSWNGVNYMRALPVNVRNPRSLKQRIQRRKLAVCLNFLQSIAPYVRVGYKPLDTVGTSPFSLAMSYLLRNAVQGDGLNLTLDYRRVLVARGPLTGVFDASASVGDGLLQLFWEDNSGQGDALPTDLAMLLVYNKVKGVAIYDTSPAVVRADGGLQLELPVSWAEDALAVYLAFRNADDERLVSNSVCLLDDAYEILGEADGTDTGETGSSAGKDDENPMA